MSGEHDIAAVDRAEATRRGELERLVRVGLALSAERNRERLLERILMEAKNLCHADGGTLYLRTEDDRALRFAIVRTDSLGLAMGGTAELSCDLPPVPLYEEDGGAPNHNNVVAHSVHVAQSVNIPDAYTAEGFDFTGTKEFDASTGYRSRSFLTLPMQNQEGRVIGVLQLLNARDPSGQVVAFTDAQQKLAEALASQAAVALDNQMLLASQAKLMEAFIEVIAGAIDDKSPYTGSHCRRVPELTRMITEAVCETRDGPYADFSLDPQEWFELRIAAWLHDCGKVTTPTHVMDKSTKLETIVDRIHEVETRAAVIRQELRLGFELARQAEPARAKALKEELDRAYAALEDDLSFLRKANAGAEYFPPEAVARLKRIAERQWTDAEGRSRRFLSEEEVDNLRVSRGTLTEGERLIINGHMVQTIRMLEALPFPRTLAGVPELACGHHERMDGSGYPRGVYAQDLPVGARAMAIADIFEALTAQDRPYKKGKPLSVTINIMGRMKADNHIDPELFDIFIKSGVYRRYAEAHLDPTLIDAVDEAAVLSIRPKPFTLPPEAERARRKAALLPEYQRLLREPGEGAPGVQARATETG